MAAFAAAILVVVSGCGGPDDAGGADPAGREVDAGNSGESGVLAPPGMALPYVVEPACPGEGCAYGTWRACDSVPVLELPDVGATTVAHLRENESFEVQVGRVVVEVPEAVVLTRPTRQFGFSDEGVLFSEGDTVYVLDYLGEGYFNVWSADSILETEVFWPWDAFIPGSDFEYGGEVVQPGQRAFWVRITAGNVGGWVRADQASVLSANSIDPAPLVCY